MRIDNRDTKLRSFKAEFRKVFLVKLEELQQVASSTKEISVEYSFAASIGISLVEYVVGNCVEGIPLIGPFAATFVTVVPTQIYEYYEKKGIKKDAVEYNDALAELGSTMIEAVLEETGHEIVRIFEYQISMIEHISDVERLANYAVNKVFSHAQDSKGVGLNRNDLLQVLIGTEDVGKLEKLQNKVTREFDIETQGGDTWKIFKIFTKAGLRTEIDGGGYSFNIKPDTKESELKYGYRARVFEWDAKTGRYVNSPLDQGYTASPTEAVVSKALLYGTKKKQAPHSNDAMGYSLLYRVLSVSDIDAYLQQNSTTSLQQFLVNRAVGRGQLIAGKVTPTLRDT